MTRLPERLGALLLPAGEGSIQERLFRSLTLLGGLLSLFLVAPANLLQGLPLGATLSTATFGLATLGFHAAARRGRCRYLPQFLLFLALLNGLWFLNAGSQGPILMFFFVAALYAVVFFTGWLRAGSIAVLVADGVALQILEQRWPNWVVPYPDPSFRFFDLTITYVIALGICSLLLYVVLAGYQREHLRLEQAQRAVQESERRYAATFHSLPVAIAVAELGSGRLLAVNEGFAALFGCTAKEILGQSSLDLGLWADPEQRSQVVNTLTGGGAVRNLPVQIRRRDGQLRWTHLAAERVELDGIPCLLSTALDVTEQREAHARLQASEASYRGLFESVEEAIYILDRQGTFLDVNDGAVRMYGYQREELVGRSPELVSAPGLNDLPAVGRAIAAAFAGEPQAFPFWGRRKNGEAFPKEVRLSKGTYFGQEVVIAVALDVTARKRAEEALRAGEAKLQEAAAMANLGYWEIDHRSGQVAWSEGLYAMHGRRPEDGPPDWAAFQERIHANDRPTAAQRYDAHLAEGTPEFSCQYRIHHPDGGLRHIRTRVRTEFAEDGRPLRSFGTDQDVTDQMLLEQRRLQADSLAQATFESTLEGLLVVDREGRITGANQRFRQIWDLGDASPGRVGDADLQARVRERVVDPEGFFARLRWLREHPEAEAIDPVLFRDGRVFERYTCPQRQAGAIVGRVWSYREVTERKRAEEARLALEAQLHHLHRMESVGRLAGGISHDMNNVLAAIMSVSELLRRKDGEDARHLDLILEATRRGRTLVQGLLAFARKEVEDAEQLDLNELVRKEAELLRSTTLQQVRLELDLDPRLPRLVGSTAALSTALMNLCVNAVDAMPEGGTLRLVTRLLGARDVELRVEDSGHGMPPEVAARALEPFFTTKPVGKGTGLGLSMVFGTVQAHGGSVEIASQPGRGTQVRVTLPVAPGEAPRARPDADTETAGRTRTLRVLFVDDDPLIRQTGPALLESQGHRVTVAGGGYEALGLAEHGSGWDLVILDLNMPDLNGVETLERLRRLHPQLPVLVATGYADEQVRARISTLGRVSILGKPYSGQELQAALGALG